jgi:putative membrane protein
MMKNKSMYVCACTLFVIFVWSLIEPKDLFTWFMEAFPILIGLPIFIATRNKFRFTNLVYVLLMIHAAILLVGAHYTYAEVPFFNWLRDHFHLSRNYYDRIGHLAQGFIPAIVMREVLIRNSVIQNKKWLDFLVICFCLALSATYEFIEWWTSLLTGAKGDAFLGTQGDVWDTQWDMLCALIGAIVAIIGFGRIHDHQLNRYDGSDLRDPST